jgi:branched-chain amino acid transport system substrate-binding protein
LEAIQTAEFAYNQLGLRKMVIFYINTDYGVGFKDIFQKHFESLGGKIIYIESFDQGQSDFRTQITKMKGIKPDGVYILGVPIEVGYILKQSVEIGFKTKFLMNNMEDPNLIKIAGKSADGIFFAIPIFDSNSPDPKIQNFVKEYKNKYGRIPDMFAADAYDAVYLAKLAIEKGGYNAAGIKTALYNIKGFPGVNGNITFDKNGDVIKPLTIKTVKNGEFISIESK